MNSKFDELAKAFAQAVTRRQALKRFSAGLAGMALACFGLVGQVEAAKPSPCACLSDTDCGGSDYCSGGFCIPRWCIPSSDPCCCRCVKGKSKPVTGIPSCAPFYSSCASYCGSLVLTC